MKNIYLEIKEIESQINRKEDTATSFELELLSIKKQIHEEIDEINIVFLKDHQGFLQYQLDCINAELYLLRKDLNSLKITEKLAV